MQALENPRFGEIARFWDVLYGGARFSAPFDAFHHSEAAFVESGRLDADFLHPVVERHLSGRATVLDFGCGAGRVLLPLSEKFPRVKFRGTDISPKALQIGRQRGKGAKNVSFHAFDGRSAATIEDGSIDLVLSWRVVERIPRHMFNIVLREFNRVLSTGGTLFFDAPILPPTKQRTKIIDEPLDEDPVSPRRYDEATLAIFLERAGFEIVGQSTHERNTSARLDNRGPVAEYAAPFRFVQARKQRTLEPEGYAYAREALCNICGNAHFGAGPIGRTARTRVWPRCTGCRALCRMRILRKILDRVPRSVFEKRKALQFSPELSYKPEWFKSFLLSIYDGDNSNAEGLNSMDLQALPLRGGSYDWIICNHVLEHIENDHLAMQEMVRVCSKNGVLQLAVPGPLVTSKTRNFGQARPEEHFHFRSYGRDFPDLLLSHAPDWHGISIIEQDHISNVKEIFYFFSRNIETLRTISEPQEGSAEIIWHGAGPS
jgi:SAM-dependent methyltransferase